MSLTPESLVATVGRPINEAGAVFYFSPATRAAGKELGLDGFRFYFLGRGGVLGHPTAEVVHSAFGYFDHELVAKMWNSGAEIVEPARAAAVFFAACADMGRERLAGLDLAPFCAAAEQVVRAADAAGLTLFAGARAMPLAADPPGRALQLVTVLREFRGSAHLVAVRSAGLEARVAHLVKRPEDAEMFGYPKDAGSTVTDADRRAHAEAEMITDRIVLPAFATLDEAGRRALLDGVAAIAAALRDR